MSDQKCPICGKPAVVERRPFCSSRCADVDLHRWLTNGYAAAVIEEDESSPQSDDEA